MSGNDLLVRLLLNTDGFNRNLEGSKKNVSSFESDIKGMAGKAGAAIGKFAGALGLAMGATEAMGKALNSSQAIGDKYAETMDVVKNSVDQFFYSLTSGDFSSFLGGMDSMIKKARAAYAAMDQLGNTKISHGYFSAKYEAGIQEAQYTAKNKFAPLDKRQEAFGQWRENIQNISGINETLKSDLLTAITTSVEKEIGSGKMKVNMDDIEMALRIDVTNPNKRSKLKSQYADDYEEYVEQLNEASKLLRTGSKTEAERMNDSKQYYTILESLNTKYREAIIVNAMLNKYKDEELTEIANMASESAHLTSQIKSISREYNETANEFNNANKAVKGFTAVTSLEGFTVYGGNSEASNLFSPAGDRGGSIKESPIVAGSIAALDIEIKDATKRYAEAATDAARQAAYKALQDLKEMKADKEFYAKHPEPPKVTKGGGSLASLAEIPEIPKEIKPIELVKKDQKASIDEITQSMTALGAIFGGEAGSMVDYFANIVMGSAQAAAAIAALIPVKKADANANAEEAVSGAAASTSSIPVIGWIMAASAVASVIAAITSVPKYAHGGIVPGTSFSGDNVPAYLNSGEMVLNPGQQARLFALANGEGGGNNLRGEVKLSGKDIFITLRNYMKASGNRL